MNSKDTILNMNEWGMKNIPFIFIIDYTMDDSIVIPAGWAMEYNILFDFNGYVNYAPVNRSSLPVISDLQPVGFDRYLKAFNYVQQELNKGNSYLVNLTFPTPINLQGPLEDIFYYSKAKYKLLYKNHFVVFSPESFVRIKEGKIYTHPMKGTINASVEGARELILNDPKEKAEHATIVDLLRNDISIFASRVEVNRYRYIDRIKSNNRDLLQVSSEISGELPADYKHLLGDIIFSLLPAGSVTGAPKRKTLEIIRNAEDYERGFYTGIAGYYDGKNLESCVLIRFIEREGDQYLYKSGGGITAMSQAEKEYQELIDKIYVPVD